MVVMLKAVVAVAVAVASKHAKRDEFFSEMNGCFQVQYFEQRLTSSDLLLLVGCPRRSALTLVYNERLLKRVLMGC